MRGEPTRCAIVPPAPAPYRDPLYRRLASRGRIAPSVIYQSSGQPDWDQPPEWFRAGGGYPSTVLRARQRGRLGRTPIVIPKGLDRALGEADPACVVAWEYGPASIQALAWCKSRGRRYVVFSELTRSAEETLSKGQRQLHRALAPLTDGFVAASGAARERLLALGVPAGRVEVSLQSADVEAFRAVAGSRPAEGDGPLRVLSVGRLVADKQPQRLVEAVAAAGSARLTLVGTGPLEDDVRDAAERFGVELDLRGYVAPEELPALCAEADVAALVSSHEPFGVFMRESAAAGLPLVCSRVAGAVGDVAVEGRNALVVEPESTDSIASALRRLAQDPELRARLADASRAIDAANDPEHDAEAFERVVLGER